jgi:hypothetical protein
MKTLRVLRNVAALFIIAMALVASWPGAQLLRVHANGSCYFDSASVGYNCSLNSDFTCSSSKCKAGYPCNNGVCVAKSCGYKKGSNCYIDANNHCKESGCGGKSIFGCTNSGCI